MFILIVLIVILLINCVWTCKYNEISDGIGGLYKETRATQLHIAAQNERARLRRHGEGTYANV